MTTDPQHTARQGILNYLTGQALCSVPRPVEEAEALLDAYQEAILAASSAVAQSAPAKTALRDRILQALADALKPRYGGPQHNTPGGLPLTATAEEARLHRARPLADAVLAVLPAAAPAVSSVGQAAHTTRSAVLREAIARVEDPAERKGLGWESAREVLRRMADETQPAEAEPTESVIYEVVGDWGVDGADSAEGARAAVAKWLRAYPKCGAHAQQRIVREWDDGSEFYGPWTDLPAVEAQQPTEA